MAQWTMLLAFFVSLSAFAIQDDGPGGDTGGGNSKSAVDGLSSCLRKKAKEPNAQPYASDFFEKLPLKEHVDDLLHEFKKKNYKWDFRKREMDFFLNQMQRSLNSEIILHSEKVKKMGSNYTVEELFKKHFPAFKKANPKADGNYLQKLLSDCVQENDFSAMAAKLSRGCSDKVEEFESPALDNVPNNLFLGAQKLRGLDKTQADKLPQKCDFVAGVGDFFVCRFQQGSKQVLSYFDKTMKELSPEGCDSLSHVDGKFYCLAKKIIGGTTTHKVKSAHDADGKPDNAKCGKMFNLPADQQNNGAVRIKARKDTPKR